jgi:hypothetical protein
MTTKIEWAAIDEYPGYSICTDGSVIGPSGKKLKPIISKCGHQYIFIKRKKKWVHRLVLQAFVSECPEGMETRHLDGNPENNNLENLKWGTRLENANDRRKHGTMLIPHESSFTKLVPSDIPEIRKMYLDGKSSRVIGKRFGTSHTTIQKIILGKRWKGY